MVVSHVQESLAGFSSELWLHGAPGVGKTHLGLLIADRFEFGYYDCGDISAEISPELFDYLDVGCGIGDFLERGNKNSLGLDTNNYNIIYLNSRGKAKGKTFTEETRHEIS